MPIPTLDRPVYADFDLGAMDDALGGQTIRILQNPTVAFRAAFVHAARFPGQGEWAGLLREVLGCKTDREVLDIIDGLEQALVSTLFSTSWERYDEETERLVGERSAYVLRIWEEYAQKKRRTYLARLHARSEATPLPSPSPTDSTTPFAPGP